MDACLTHSDSPFILDISITKVILIRAMKTAISIPDPLFQAAEVFAKRLKKSRSELYAEAVSEYINTHRNQDVTKILNEVYAHEPSTIDKELYRMQSRSVIKEEW